MMNPLLIVIFLINYTGQVNCQCFPIDGRIPQLPSSLLTSSTHDHDLGGNSHILIDGDILSSFGYDSRRKTSQLDTKHNEPSSSSFSSPSNSSSSPSNSSSSPSTFSSLSSSRKGGSSWKELLWPGKIIPFNYHPSISERKKSLIERGMEHFEVNTCIRFKSREESDEYWITFRSDSSGCYSFLGRDDSCRGQGQPVSLSRGCDTLLIAAHEIGHVVGLKHQHNRPDRDEYIHINWNNIDTVNQRYFQRDNLTETFGLPFDFTSLMQYNMWHFSSDVFNKSSMVTLDPMNQRLLGKSSGLSFWDRKLVNFMYSCNETCSKQVECMNGGYLYPVKDSGRRESRGNDSESSGNDSESRGNDSESRGNDSESCECLCPPNFTGKGCETRVAERYYDAIDPLTCGGVIDATESDFNDNEIGSVRRKSILIETLGYPGPRKSSVSCSWIIHVPPSSLAVLSFESFNLTSRSNEVGKSWNGKCMNESLEIRSRNSFEGQFYCGSDIKSGQIMVFNQTDRIILILQSFDGKSSGSFRTMVTVISGQGIDSTLPSIPGSTIPVTKKPITSRPSKTGSESITKVPTFPTTEGHVKDDESEEEGEKGEGEEGMRKHFLGIPLDRLITLPLQVITSLIKSVNQGFERG